MQRNELIDAQAEAARALETGRRIAERAIKTRNKRRATGGGGPAVEDVGAVPVVGADLGRLIGTPSAFWAGACALQAMDADAIEALDAELRLTAAQVAAGNLDRLREALIGQATWLGMVAVNLATDARWAKDDDDGRQTMRLALAAQRQAAQTLASVAALARFEVQVGD